MVVFDANPLPLITHSRTASSESHHNNATIHVSKLYDNKKPVKVNSVRFSTEPATIIRNCIYTDKEKRKCFYQRKDRRVFENDRIQTCILFERKRRNGEMWEENEDVTLFGLEDFFGRLSKEEARKIHVSKVLNEQNRQLRCGEWLDETTIRFVSSESSGEARAFALELAQQQLGVMTRNSGDAAKDGSSLWKPL